MTTAVSEPRQRARPGVDVGVWRVLWALVGIVGLAASFVLPPLWALIGVCGLAAFLVTLRWPVAGLVLFAFSVPWGGGFPVTPAGAPLTSTELIVAGLTAAWILSGVVERRLPLGTRLWTPYLLFFLAVIGVSTTQAADTHASLREILKWVEMTLVYLAAVWFVRSRRDLAVIVVALVLAGVSQALLGYIQFAFHLGPQAFAVRGNFLRAYGTFDQPNPYAGYLNMVLPLAMTMALVGGEERERTLYGLAALLMTGAVVVSESRGALLAAVVANSIVLAVLYWRYRLLASVAVVAGATGGLLASFNLVPTGPFERLLDAAGLGNVSFGNVTNANFSAVERAAHWLAGVRMFAAHPLLGVGIGNYAVAYPAYHPRGWYDPLEHAHNYYINIAAEAGVAGLLAYLLLIGSALWYCCALLRHVRDRLLLAVILGVLGALVATSFHNIFDVLYVHGMAALLGLLVALAAVSARLTVVDT